MSDEKLTLQYGKRYVRRDGRVTEPLKSPTKPSYHEYIDPEDIVREYTEEKPVKKDRKPFEVGQKIKFVDGSALLSGFIAWIASDGTLQLEAVYDCKCGTRWEHHSCEVHPRQVIARIKPKKKKPKLREWWAVVDQHGCLGSNQPRRANIGPCFDGAIRVREVREKR